MPEDELAKISFEQDVEIIARRLVDSGGAVNLAAAKLVVRPWLKQKRADDRAEEEAEEESERFADQGAPGRAGRRRGVFIV